MPFIEYPNPLKSLQINESLLLMELRKHLHTAPRGSRLGKEIDWWFASLRKVVGRVGVEPTAR